MKMGERIERREWSGWHDLLSKERRKEEGIDNERERQRRERKKREADGD